MVDRLTPEKRSWNMSRIKCRDTGPEMLVRSTLHRLGYRFSLQRKDLPGKPDIVLPKHRTVVFVHGCFWHQHKDCTKSKLPANNREFWKKKLKHNEERDRKVIACLNRLGWRVLVCWQCQIDKSLEKVKNRLDKQLRRVLSSA